ncbi:hypothetical protein ACHAXT_007579 [Thalassiosira profunda]
MAAPTPPSILDDAHAFWAQRWSGPKLGWHKDDVNPHLQKYANKFLENDREHESRVLVPLCGKSVDLAFLATHPKVSHVAGIDIVRNAATDFSSEHPEFALEENQGCQSIFRGKKLSIHIGDLFDLLPMSSNDWPKQMMPGTSSQESSAPWEYMFDRIFDRASIVAIDPSLRKDYVQLMGEMIRPGGIILLVTLDRRKTATDEAKKDGPPFSINEAEVRKLYETQPWVESVEKLDEVDDLTTEADKERWAKKGVLELYELVFLIKKKE